MTTTRTDTVRVGVGVVGVGSAGCTPSCSRGRCRAPPSRWCTTRTRKAIFCEKPVSLHLGEVDDDPPRETLLEETDYHRIAPERGFGRQRVYTGDRALDETLAFSAATASSSRADTTPSRPRPGSPTST